MMSEQDLTQEEKDELVKQVTVLTEKNVLKHPDMVEILTVCQDACKRRIAEIDAKIGPGGPVQ